VEPLGSVLKRALDARGLGGELEGWRAVDEWPRAVGPRVARHSRAVAFREGALVVEVDGSAWLHQLGFLKRNLLRALNARLGTDGVRDLRFRSARGGNLR
jgi:predicted nucleic acid-binding Zn ribbon protein